MPIYDHECPKCDKIFEAIAGIDEISVPCECGAQANRIISCGQCYTGNEDADWLKSVLEVVDKDNPSPATQEFIKNPNRSNYRAWMKSEGIRPLENNEPMRPQAPDMSRVNKEVWRKFQERHRIEI